MQGLNFATNGLPYLHQFSPFPFLSIDGYLKASLFLFFFQKSCKKQDRNCSKWKFFGSGKSGVSVSWLCTQARACKDQTRRHVLPMHLKEITFSNDWENISPEIIRWQEKCCKNCKALFWQLRIGNDARKISIIIVIIVISLIS